MGSIPASFNILVKFIKATVEPPGLDHPESILISPTESPLPIVLSFFVSLIQEFKTLLV